MKRGTDITLLTVSVPNSITTTGYCFFFFPTLLKRLHSSHLILIVHMCVYFCSVVDINRDTTRSRRYPVSRCRFADLTLRNIPQFSNLLIYMSYQGFDKTTTIGCGLPGYQRFDGNRSVDDHSLHSFIGMWYCTQKLPLMDLCLWSIRR